MPQSALTLVLDGLDGGEEVKSGRDRRRRSSVNEELLWRAPASVLFARELMVRTGNSWVGERAAEWIELLKTLWVGDGRFFTFLAWCFSAFDC